MLNEVEQIEWKKVCTSVCVRARRTSSTRQLRAQSEVKRDKRAACAVTQFIFSGTEKRRTSKTGSSGSQHANKLQTLGLK